MEPLSRLRVGLVQMNSGANLAANIAAFERHVAQAAGQGAQLVATPENTFFMEAPGERGPRHEEAQHPGVAAAQAAAKQHGVWLLVGSVAVLPERTDDKKTCNRSLLVAPGGAIAARYDKIHLFDVDVGDGQTYRESAKILPGNKAVVAKLDNGLRMTNDEEKNATVIRPPSFIIGMTICYDVRFPQLYRALAKAGAQVLTVPAAFTQTTGEAHWHVLLRARAIENGCFVIAPAQCGTHPGDRKTFGHSLAVGPWGEVLADGGTNEGVVMADLDLAEVERVRKKIPSLTHDRPFA